MPEIDKKSTEDPGPTRRSKQSAPTEGGPIQLKPVEADPKGDMRHRVAPSIVVEEESGVAAAEATGKIWTDNDEDPQETAGSG